MAVGPSRGDAMLSRTGRETKRTVHRSAIAGWARA